MIGNFSKPNMAMATSLHTTLSLCLLPLLTIVPLCLWFRSSWYSIYWNI